MFHDLLDILYPRVCYVCDKVLAKNQNVLCSRCLHDLPVADFHLEKENPVEQIFYGRLPLENATALLLFEKKGMVQKLIHNLKYRGHEEIGTYFGKWLGEELKQQPSYAGISAVIPVPLHKKKLRKRGYNQVAKFAAQIAEALEVPYVDDVLLKLSSTQTQTLKTRFARWGSIEETFSLNNEKRLAGAHILLVDDLVTTGATLEACAQKLLQIRGTRISIATMAVTH